MLGEIIILYLNLIEQGTTRSPINGDLGGPGELDNRFDGRTV